MAIKFPERPLEDWTPPGRTEKQKRTISYERLEDVRVAWPWPYTEPQAKRIGEMLPAASLQDAMHQIVSIGRRSVIARTAQAAECIARAIVGTSGCDAHEIARAVAAQGWQRPPRDDPRAEIERLRLALEGLSVDAQRILGIFNFSMPDLLTAVYSIEMAAPPAKPKGARGGAPRSRDAVIVVAFKNV